MIPQVQRNWLAVCLFNFLIAALMGVGLRFSRVGGLHLEYSHLLHAHSHTALLGWAYMMVFTLSIATFVPSEKRPRYRILFWLTQISVVGMMLTFPFQGYVPASITFSTLHILCSYIFAIRLFRDISTNSVAETLMRIALMFMIFSTLGAWSLGPIGTLAGKDSPFYKSAIQFFLHFQFNGWFTMSAIALIFGYFVPARIDLAKLRRAGTIMVLSVVLMLGFPLSWYFSNDLFRNAGWVGAVLQCLAILMLWQMFDRSSSGQRQAFPISLRLFLWLAAMSFGLKALLQLLPAFPVIARASHQYRDLAVGFIHLAMLGAVTGVLLFLVSGRCRIWAKGSAVFCASYLATEILIFARGLREWLFGTAFFSEELLLLASACGLATAILLLLASVLRGYDFRHTFR